MADVAIIEVRLPTGLQGPQGVPGNVSPELLNAKDDAVAAADSAAGVLEQVSNLASDVATGVNNKLNVDGDASQTVVNGGPLSGAVAAISSILYSDFGITANGVTDDTAAWTVAATMATKPVLLPSGLTSIVKTRLTFAAGGGIVGGGKLKTSFVDFTSTTGGGNFSSFGTVVQLSNRGRFDAKIEHTSQLNGWVSALMLRGVADCWIGPLTELWGFNNGAVITLDSVLRLKIEPGATVRDCYLDVSSGFAQLSGINSDNNQVDGVVSDDCDISLIVRRMKCNPARAVTLGKYETDGINLAYMKNSRIRGYVEEAGELFDFAGLDHCNVDVRGRRAFALGVKIIHGTRDCTMRLDIDGSTCNLLGVFGSSTAFASAFTATAATDVLAVSLVEYNRLVTADTVTVTSTGTLPSGLALATTYYVIKTATVGEFKLATTEANARAGVAIDVMSTGSGVHTMTHLRPTERNTIHLDGRLGYTDRFWDDARTVACTLNPLIGVSIDDVGFTAPANKNVITCNVRDMGAQPAAGCFGIYGTGTDNTITFADVDNSLAGKQCRYLAEWPAAAVVEQTAPDRKTWAKVGAAVVTTFERSGTTGEVKALTVRTSAVYADDAAAAAAGVAINGIYRKDGGVVTWRQT